MKKETIDFILLVQSRICYKKRYMYPSFVHVQAVFRVANLAHKGKNVVCLEVVFK